MSRQGSVAILGLGVSTVDDLLTVEYHPLPNDKQKVLSRTRQCGGLTGSALVAASRMGVRCGHLISLGTGELSSFVREKLTAENIELFESNADPAAEPFLSVIINERQTGERSILWDNSRALPPKIGVRERELALSAGCLFVDHVWSDGLVEVVKEARAAGVPVVGDFERTMGESLELMSATNHVILPYGYAQTLFGKTISCGEAASRLASEPGRDVACVTDGMNGSWFALGEKPEAVYRQQVFPMEHVVDTTGCGDVFHGVYAACLVKGYSPAERFLRASAAAALKTQKAGAQAGAPTEAELEAFLASRGGGK